METRQMIPFFSSTFSDLFLTFIFTFENSQNSFSCGPPFGPFWFVKYLNFGQKLPIRTAHHTFLESRHPEVTKNPCCVLSPKGSQKRYQLMDYMTLISIHVIQQALSDNIYLLKFPPNVTDTLQPLNKCCFGPLKPKWEDKLNARINEFCLT